MSVPHMTLILVDKNKNKYIELHIEEGATLATCLKCKEEKTNKLPSLKELDEDESLEIGAIVRTIFTNFVAEHEGKCFPVIEKKLYITTDTSGTH